MSEKIYACLLRLFPSTFRKYYGEEAQRLLRERLDDERGFFRRLRLTVDLVMDTVGALPQAYRNSYAQTAVGLAPHFDGIPSFRVLQKEPIRLSAIVLAGVFTISALATFSYVMELPIPYRPVDGNGRKSPIESVIERLNQPIPADSADKTPSEAATSASGNLNRSEAGPMSNADARRSLKRSSVANTTSQPIQTREQNTSANGFDRGISSTARSSQRTRTQQSMQRASVTVPVVTQGASSSHAQTSAAVVMDLSGKWLGSLQAVGGDSDIPRLFIFDQHSAELSGSAGPDSARQYPIQYGLVAGDSVLFELNYGRKTFLCNLKVEGEELRGTVSFKTSNRTRTTQVWLQRARQAR